MGGTGRGSGPRGRPRGWDSRAEAGEEPLLLDEARGPAPLGRQRRLGAEAEEVVGGPESLVGGEGPELGATNGLQRSPGLLPRSSPCSLRLEIHCQGVLSTHSIAAGTRRSDRP